VLPLQGADIAPDMVVAAGYKWLLGPYSVGYMWSRPIGVTGVPCNTTGPVEQAARTSTI
jgi:selenocysteine lyase/cysteine desulfurase